MTPAPLTHLPLVHLLALCSSTPLSKPALMTRPLPVHQLRAAPPVWPHPRHSPLSWTFEQTLVCQVCIVVPVPFDPNNNLLLQKQTRGWLRAEPTPGLGYALKPWTGTTALVLPFDTTKDWFPKPGWSIRWASLIEGNFTIRLDTDRSRALIK